MNISNGRADTMLEGKFMRALVDREATEWCTTWPLQLEFDNEGVLCAPPTGQTYRLDISAIRWRDLVPMATALACLGSHSLEQFSGGLLWVRRTGITSPDWEIVLLRLLARFRLSYKEDRPLDIAPAQLFNKEDFLECASVLLIVLLAEWDAYFVHPSGDWVAFISNDDHITVTTRTAKIGADIKESLDAWGPTTKEVAPPKLF